jgi:hypothetical protein
VVDQVASDHTELSDEVGSTGLVVEDVDHVASDQTELSVEVDSLGVLEVDEV